MRQTRTGLIVPALSMILALLTGCGPQKPVQTGNNVVSTGAALIGGPFQLVDQEGRLTDQRVLNGKWSAVFFGYTYCPDVCPTTLQTLALTKTKLGGAAKDLQIVFVSVDPERDTPAQLKAYLATAAFPQPTLGLTGSPEQVAAAAKVYRVYYKKQGAGDGYAVDHSAIIYLMNPQGKFDRPLAESLSPAEMAAQISDAMHASS